MRVFLIDDSPQVIECLKDMLSPLARLEVLGYATDIPDALRAIRNVLPDVVVLDLHLPSGSGMEILKTLRKEMLATKVIVLTNYAFPQYRRRCMALGAYAFLDKSSDFMAVPQLIRALADAKSDPPETPPPPDSFLEPRAKVGSR